MSRQRELWFVEMFKQPGMRSMLWLLIVVLGATVFFIGMSWDEAAMIVGTFGPLVALLWGVLYIARHHRNG